MALEHTGERVVADHYRATAQGYLIYLFQSVVWSWAVPMVEGRDVLDFGCGSGEGTARMAAHARSMLGVDVSGASIEYAVAHHDAPNTTYLRIEDRVPRPDASFDVVCSFQVIEHVPDPDAYLAEARRLLRPGGVMLLATPDRRTRLLRWQRPWNRWHVQEWEPEGFSRLLGHHFDDVDVLTMSGRPELLASELKRTRRLRWMTLPLTVPGLPQAARVRGLEALFRLKQSRAGAAGEPEGGWGFDESDLEIGHDLWPSTNLVAVARAAG